MFAHTKGVIRNLGEGILLSLVVTIFDRNFFKEGKVQNKHQMFWAWVCLIALALLGLCNKCAFGQDSTAFGTLPSGDAGMTKCDTISNTPHIIIAYGLDEEQLSVVLIHERLHSKRMRAYPGGCKEFSKRYGSDERFQFTEELEAYCSAEYKYAINLEAKKYQIDRITMILFEAGANSFMPYSVTKAKVISRCVAIGGNYVASP